MTPSSLKRRIGANVHSECGARCDPRILVGRSRRRKQQHSIRRIDAHSPGGAGVQAIGAGIPAEGVERGGRTRDEQIHIITRVSGKAESWGESDGEVARSGRPALAHQIILGSEGEHMIRSRRHVGVIQCIRPTRHLRSMGSIHQGEPEETHPQKEGKRKKPL